jgi:hypothetical protein
MGAFVVQAVLARRGRLFATTLTALASWFAGVKQPVNAVA